MVRPPSWFLLGGALLVLLAARPGRAAELQVETSLRALGTSNVFSDRSQEVDASLRVTGDLRLDFASYWSTGYAGKYTAFAHHHELMAHHHELFLFLNPVWGKDGKHELVAEVRVETLRNSSTYASLNLVRPLLVVKLALEPRSWLRLEGEMEGSFRLFYDERSSDSVDGLAELRIAFMLPSRTTLLPFGRYGVRRFVRATATVSDVLDQQVDVGLRVGQGLWRKAGLKLEYAHRFAFGESGLLLRKASAPLFQILGDDFVWQGHRGDVVLKQLFGPGCVVRAGGAVERRLYAGWPAIGADGTLTGEYRRDLRVAASAGFGVSWQRQAGSRWPAGELVAEVTRLWQWSTSDWYQTAVNVGGLMLSLSW